MSSSSSSSSSSASSSKSLKVYFTLPTGKQEIRRFTTTDPLVLAALNAFLSATYERAFTPPLRFVLQFDDGEDLCSISSEAELQDALALHAASAPAGQAMKLLAAFDTSPLQQQSVESAAGTVPPTPTHILAQPLVSEEGELVRATSGDSDGDYERIEEEQGAATVVAPVEAASAKGSAPSASPSPSVEEVTATAAPTALATPLVEDPSPVQSPVEIEDVTNKSAPSPKAQSGESEGVPAAAAAAAAGSSSSASSSSAEGPAIHRGVRCDECSAYPIVGTRFNCLTCGPSNGGFDLCARCESNSKHVHELKHEFAVHVTPVQRKQAQTDQQQQQQHPAAIVQAAVQKAVQSFAAAVQSNGASEGGAASASNPLAALQSSIGEVVSAFKQAGQQHRDQRRAAHAEWQQRRQQHQAIWQQRMAEAAAAQQQQTTQTQTESAASSSSASATGPAEHTGVTCDGCGQSPIVGVRFQCQDCRVPGGFDLCAACEEGGFSNEQHDANKHALLKIRVPTVQPRGPHGGRGPHAGRGPWGHAHWGRGFHQGPHHGGPHHGAHPHFGHGGPFGGHPGAGPFPFGGPRGPFGGLGAELGGLLGGLGGLFGAGGFGGGRGGGHHGGAPCFGRGGGRGGFGFGGRCGRDDPNRPRAEFVSDVTLADGLEVRAGETLHKVWSIKNVGAAPWPVGTKLIFVGGDLAPESDGRWGCDAQGALVPYAGPGDVVHVAMDIVVPNEAGRYRTTFRLQTAEGDRFGPRVWIDVRVPEQNNGKEAAAGDAAAEVKPAEGAAAAAAATPNVVPTAAAAAASALVQQAAEEARLAAELAAEFRAAHVSAPAVEPAAAPAAEADAAAASVPAGGHHRHGHGGRHFPYMQELGYLRSMGFVDGALNKYLLLNNKGDLQLCVQWLLANAKQN